MINEILSRKQCGDCKGCCVFDADDAWEVQDIVGLTPPNGEGVSVCLHLGEDGCRLGEEKPIECAMYPFRVMSLGGYKVVAVSKFCKPVNDLPLSRLLRFAEEKQSEFLGAGVVKEYNREYVILKVIEQ
jgi:hypothetical protein